MRSKSSIKLRRCARYKARYTARIITTKRNKLRRSLKREKQVAFFKTHPHSGSPSQIRARKLGYNPAPNKLAALRLMDAIANGEAI